MCSDKFIAHQSSTSVHATTHRDIHVGTCMRRDEAACYTRKTMAAVRIRHALLTEQPA